jgi:hypothetical protein
MMLNFCTFEFAVDAACCNRFYDITFSTTQCQWFVFKNVLLFCLSYFRHSLAQFPPNLQLHRRPEDRFGVVVVVFNITYILEITQILFWYYFREHQHSFKKKPPSIIISMFCRIFQEQLTDDREWRVCRAIAWWERGKGRPADR